MSGALPKALLVEDSPTDALLVKHALRRDYAVDQVRTVNEAMERLAAGDYLFVITDYRLPTMSGLDLLAWIKEQGLNVPVIVASSQGDERVAAGALKQGACDYIIKTEDNIASLPIVVRQALRRYELEQRNRLLTQIVESANDTILTVNDEDRVVTANRALRDTFGYEPEASVGLGLTDLFPQNVAENRILPLALARVRQGDAWRGEVSAQRRDGSQFPVQLSLSLMRERESGPRAVIAIISDISERRKLVRELERLSITDALTGLSNYRFFHDRLRYEYLRATRYAQPLGCIMIDIDYFKVVNDTYGHQVGDEVLKELARLVKGATREADIVARYGGEEFAILLPNTSSLGTQVCAEHIWHTVGTAPIQVGDKTIRITVSVGVSTLATDVRDEEELLRRADHALYSAKRRGRNNVCGWEELQEVPDDGRAAEEDGGGSTRDGLASRLRHIGVAMRSRYLESLQPMVSDLLARHPYLAHHASNVAVHAVELARALKLDEVTVERIRVAAVLYDIGMALVPREILDKPGPLTASERERVREHAAVGEALAAEIPFLDTELPAVRHHHERFDGTGYPDGKAGQDIPIGARLLAVADAYDAMVSKRPYRDPMPSERALDELKRCAGAQFDPLMVETFVAAQLRIIGERAAASRGGPASAPRGG